MSYIKYILAIHADLCIAMRCDAARRNMRNSLDHFLGQRTFLHLQLPAGDVLFNIVYYIAPEPGVPSYLYTQTMRYPTQHDKIAGCIPHHFENRNLV